jgi:hypothetical protein
MLNPLPGRTQHLRVRLLVGASAFVSCLAVIGVVGGTLGFARGVGPSVCSGTSRSPGSLHGRFAHGVVIRGYCRVDAGLADVRGNLRLDRGAALLADYAINRRTGRVGSRLTVTHDLVVGRGATLILGCGGQDSPCVDSHQLSSPARIGGDLTAAGPLGVDVHNATIAGNVRETGGGGGLTCRFLGPFAGLSSPAYSGYEDSTVSGGVSVAGLRSCWLGLARLHVGRSVTLTDNQLHESDAIEVLHNTIGRDLSCSGNSHVWDSSEQSANLYPRRSEPNLVHGRRRGQCMLQSPASAGAQPGPGAF